MGIHDKICAYHCGQSHVQIFSLYSIPHSHQNAKEYLNNLLQMTLQQAMTIPLPFIVCGDFNME
jgi:endonuclease/exonuclease/phosphatase family metal-dependent hydrolase